MKEKFIKFFYSAERNQTADLLKGLAVIFMIQVHITENFLYTNIHKQTFGMVSFFLGGAPAAPVFMVVMGFFISLKNDFLIYLERGVILFLGGILLNIGLNFYSLVLYFQNQVIGENPLEYIFGVDILPFAGLSLIIIGLLKEVFRNRFYFYLILGLLVAFVSDYIPALPESSNQWTQYILSFAYGCTEWSYFPIFPWLFYPLLGFSFRIFYERELSFLTNQIILTIVVLIFATYLILFFKDSFEEVIILKNYYHHGISLALWNAAFVVVWSFIIVKVEKYFGKNLFFVFIKWLGKNVTAIYIFQWLIIGNLAIIFYDSQNELQFFLWVFVVLILSSILTFYYERNKMKQLSVQTNE